MNFTGYTRVTEKFKQIPKGRYQARIDGVEETTAGGYQCVRVHMVVDSYRDGKPDVYTIFDRPQDEKKAFYWDYEFTRFLDSFKITNWNASPNSWVGRTGTIDVYSRYDKKADKSFTQIMPVLPTDEQTKDYLPPNNPPSQPSTQWQNAQWQSTPQSNGFTQRPPQPSASQNTGFVPNNPAQVYNQDGFPEDIPF